jgi:hypothetical protein
VRCDERVRDVNGNGKEQDGRQQRGWTLLSSSDRSTNDNENVSRNNNTLAQAVATPACRQ